MATKVTRFSTSLSSVVSISPSNTVSSPAPRQNICTAGEATSTEQQDGCCERLLVKLCDPGMKLQTQREGVYAAVGSQMWEGHWQVRNNTYLSEMQHNIAGRGWEPDLWLRVAVVPGRRQVHLRPAVAHQAPLPLQRRGLALLAGGRAWLERLGRRQPGHPVLQRARNRYSDTGDRYQYFWAISIIIISQSLCVCTFVYIKIKMVGDDGGSSLH